jgi:hypothetical protein
MQESAFRTRPTTPLCAVTALIAATLFCSHAPAAESPFEPQARAFVPPGDPTNDRHTLLVIRRGGGGLCARGVGPGNLLAFGAMCWLGLAGAKWRRRIGK